MQNKHYCNSKSVLLKIKFVQNKDNVVSLNLVSLKATKLYYTPSGKPK